MRAGARRARAAAGVAAHRVDRSYVCLRPWIDGKKPNIGLGEESYVNVEDVGADILVLRLSGEPTLQCCYATYRPNAGHGINVAEWSAAAR